MNITDLLSSTTEQNHNNMDNMDVSMNYDNSELLSSEFFDSVLCMENNLMDLMDDTGFLSNFEDEVNMSSDASHSDEVLSPESYYSESDKNSTYSTENTDDSTSVLNGIDGLDDTILLSICNPVTSSNDAKQMPVVATPVPVATAPPQKPTKILIQNPSNKKFIAKPILNATHLKKAPSKTKTQILKVQQVSNNGRQILLPLSVKSIKILNASTDVATLASTIKQRRIESVDSVLSDEDDTNFVSSTNNQYPALNLTNEEKRLLSKEGIQLPSHHPLTKNEERELKRIRRKIRNKISAQDSRKRKKEYVDGLEERVKRGSEENKNLLQRVKELQRENKTLIAHVNRLQALICKSTTSKATPSTCLMVVLLSALLVSIPNMRLFENKQMPVENEQVSIRRSLLSSPQTTEDDLNMEEFLVFKDEELGDLENKFAEDAVDIENSTDKEFAKMLDIGKKYENFVMENNSSDKSIFGKLFETMKNVLENKSEFLEKKPPDFGGSYNNKGFIEPDIDEYKAADDGPPLKRAKYVHDYPNIKSESVVSSTTIQISKDK